MRPALALTAPPRAGAPLRWVGGSQRILPHLLNHLPDDWQSRRYVDPFIGGGALFWALEPERALVGDACAPLVALWRSLRDHLPQLLAVLEALEGDRVRMDHAKWYAARRDRMNVLLAGCAHPVSMASALVALNRSCFNGLWRVNRNGAVNVALDPASATRDLVQRERFTACHKVLQRCQLQTHAGDWRPVIAQAGAGDLVYADSPYDSPEKTGQGALFAEAVKDMGHRYTAEGWSRRDTLDLVSALAAARDRGAHVIATNNATKFVMDTYREAGFNLYMVDVARSVSCDSETRGDAREVIAVGRAA